MYVFFVPQCSDLWWTIRAGIPTASDFDSIITPAKGELSKSAPKYMARLIADACGYQTPNYFTSQGRPVNVYAIEEGKNREPESRRWLEFDLNEKIEEVGFCVNDDFTLGCSPDGLTGMEVEPEAAGECRGIPYFKATAQAGVELKNPLPHTQVERLMDDGLPLECKVQPHGQMIVCGVRKVHWASYCPPHRPMRIDVLWDEYTEKVERAASVFVGQYVAALNKIRGK